MVTVALAQYPLSRHLSWNDWESHTASWIDAAAARGAQLLVFPEYGSMELVSLLTDIPQDDLGLQTSGMRRWHEAYLGFFERKARASGLTLVAPSLPVAENGRKVNRTYVFSGKGLAGYQDKFFMTRFEDEEWGIVPGKKELTLFEAEWGSFGVQICYDVEFALGAQLLAAAGAELVVAPSCTETVRGATRVHVGARARALENQLYVGVSQTVGEAPWSPAVDVNYGYAALYTPPDYGFPEEGVLAALPPQQPGWLVATLDFEKIRHVREHGQVFNFRDHQRLQAGFLEEEVVLRHVVV